MTHLGFMFLTAFFLGTIGLFTKIIGTELHPITIAFLRFFVGFLTILPFIFFLDKNWYKVTTHDIKQYFLIGLFFAINFAFYIPANYYTTIQNAVLISYTYPFFLMFFGYFLFKDIITKKQIVITLFAFVGLMIINPFDFNSTGSIGNIYALCSAISGAILFLLMRKSNMEHSIGNFVWHLLFASILLFPFALYFGFDGIENVLLPVLLFGFFSTGVAYLFYNLSLEKLSAELCSMIALSVTPVVSILLGVLFVNEVLSLRIIIGGTILILSGLYLKFTSIENN